MDGSTEYPLINSTELAGEAWAAMNRQEPDEALRLWQAFREHFPERPEGYIWPIQVLWQSGRLDEAEAVAAEAMARFPNHPELFVQFGWIANARQRWDLAAQHWAVVRSLLPERPEGYVWEARALWQSGRADEADKVAAEGLARFPEDIRALVEYAWTATARQDWEEALRRWIRVNEADPERLDGQVRTIQALRMVGRIDDSETMTTSALARHPDNIELLIEHVWAAVARQDGSAAAVRLDRARSKKENLPQIESSLGAVEQQIRSLPAGNARAAFGTDGANDEEISPNALMLAFESLGERCDFGSAQRHFGVEPLGLLRFASSPLDALVAALDDRFDTVGTVEGTGFELFGDEMILRAKKYGDMLFHTFVEGMAQEPDDKREAFFQQKRRRLTLGWITSLKKKLIADLEEARKICVYSTDEYASDADATRLFRALRAYGPNSLLYVRPARADRPAGTVEVLEDGLYAGYFPGLTDFLGGDQPPFELWWQLCLQTYRLATPAATVPKTSAEPAAMAQLDRARSKKEDLPRIEPSLGAVERPTRSLSAGRLRAGLGMDGAGDEKISSSALMLAFESIGERCDFGSVQRHFGVEPLGLLRFASNRLDSLVTALEDRFDAVGTADDTGFELFRDETIVRMKKYDMLFHTFVEGMMREPDDKREAFYQQQRRRLAFLKNKLIADLEEPQKICVYSTDEYASDADATRLFRALRAYGPNSLLYVRLTRADRPAGTVEMLEDGLYAGYFPGLTDFLGGDQPPFELWRQLCLETYRLAKPDLGSDDFENISI